MTALRNIKLLQFVVTLVVSVNGLQAAHAAEPVTALAPLKTIPAGVYDHNKTLVIPRQRILPRAGNRIETGVPAPYLGKQPSQPGGWLRGEDRYGTVLRFAPNVRGALIQTEDYGNDRVGAFWNDANTQGDTKLRANICSMVSDLAIDGRAEVRPYPWDYLERAPKPDLHGPDYQPRADGLCVQGNGFCGERLRFFQIPGTAIQLKSGHGGQGGAFGIFDNGLSVLNEITINSALNGIVVDAGDSKLHGIYISGIVHDGLTMNGPGSVVDVDHICGADRAAVVIQQAEFHTVYHEAARIGTDIMPTAHGTRFDGLNIGPGTCWERGVKIQAHGCTINGLHGTVKAESAEHPNIAGVEIMPRLVNHVIAGELVVDGDGSTALILRGHRGKVDLKGGWNKHATATFVRVAEGITGSTVELRGAGDGGTVLDLSASNLDHVDGLGNEFKIKWSGNAKRVIYPGGGSNYNLAPGNQLWIDGRLQSAEKLQFPSRKKP
jgi:hypothetical protein